MNEMKDLKTAIREGYKTILLTIGNLTQGSAVIAAKALMMLVLVQIAFFTEPLNAQAQSVYHVRPGATGANNGLDWNNAFTSFPSTLVRGATYYLADGIYGSYTFNTPLSGASLVTIRKATKNDHGSNVGWHDSYGDGVAVFSRASISINIGYLVIDGVSGGGPGNWRSGHGIEFTSPAGTNISYIILASEVSNVTVRHVYFNQIGNTEVTTARANGIYSSSTFYDSLFEYNYFDNLGGLPFFFRGGSGVIIQNNYTGDICGMSVADRNEHCEALVLWSLSDVHFRWNYIAECPSSGGFVKNASPISSDVRIYGNVFETGFPIQCNRGTCADWRIFNNTFHNTRGGPMGFDGTVNGLLFYNNLVFDSRISSSAGHYNWYSQISSHSCNFRGKDTENVVTYYPSRCDVISETFDPFINSSGNLPEDFRLTAPIHSWAGYDVCSMDACNGEKKYHIDAFGNIRGADGVWDRGAYEYIEGAISPATLSAPNNLKVK